MSACWNGWDVLTERRLNVLQGPRRNWIQQAAKVLFFTSLLGLLDQGWGEGAYLADQGELSGQELCRVIGTAAVNQARSFQVLQRLQYRLQLYLTLTNPRGLSDKVTCIFCAEAIPPRHKARRLALAVRLEVLASHVREVDEVLDCTRFRIQGFFTCNHDQSWPGGSQLAHQVPLPRCNKVTRCSPLPDSRADDALSHGVSCPVNGAERPPGTVHRSHPARLVAQHRDRHACAPLFGHAEDAALQVCAGLHTAAACIYTPSAGC
mmetsp:Transcript_21846/g.45302  ORF Transcript_21846/g.45302 Transcript_21846/m.45302 type:complete len:264 (+) Transcript_21846:153-944(+)